MVRPRRPPRYQCGAQPGNEGSIDRRAARSAGGSVQRPQSLPYRFTREWEGLADKNLAELGLPTEQETVDAYCRRAGRGAIKDWEFCLAFAMFRLGAIAQGIMGRVVAGTANDPNAEERGRRARPLADSGWALVASRAG